MIPEICATKGSVKALAPKIVLIMVKIEPLTPLGLKFHLTSLTGAAV